MKFDPHNVLRSLVKCLLSGLIIFVIAGGWSEIFKSKVGTNSHIAKKEVFWIDEFLSTIVQVDGQALTQDGYESCVYDGEVIDFNSELLKPINRSLIFLNEERFLEGNYVVSPELLKTKVHTPVGCKEIYRVVRAMSDESPRVDMRQLIWKEHHANYLVIKKNKEDYCSGVVCMDERLLSRTNPWRDLPGCVLIQNPTSAGFQFVSNIGTGGLTSCQSLTKSESDIEVELLDGSVSVPRGLGQIIRSLDWLWPSSKAYVNDRDDSIYKLPETNRIEISTGHTKAVGLHPLLTIDSNIHSVSQRLAECYTGKESSCHSIGVSQVPHILDENTYMPDKARTRLAGIAIIEIKTGNVLALASAESPCYLNDVHAVGRKQSPCPDLGGAFRKRLKSFHGQFYTSNQLPNHALFTSANPASTIKPILLASIYSHKQSISSSVKSRTESRYSNALKRSDSEQFISWMMCSDQIIPTRNDNDIVRCPYVPIASELTEKLGWNLGCKTSNGCQQSNVLDLFWGRPSYVVPEGWVANDYPYPARYIPFGSFLADENYNQDGSSENPMAKISESQHMQKKLQQCKERNWSRCGLDVVNQLWGQAETKATPLSLATLYANIASSAQSPDDPMPYPHIVQSLLDVNGEPHPYSYPWTRWPGPGGAVGIDSRVASQVLQAMGGVHQYGGTGWKGCTQVFGKRDLCKGDLGLASKTGTTTFRARSVEDFRSSKTQLRPWRWFGGLIKRDPNSSEFDYAFAILTEQNWTNYGKVAGEKFPSPASEMGFHLLRLIRQIEGQPLQMKTNESGQL